MKNKITLLKISILLLFLFSGFCSLVYEVSWMRSFGLIFGNNTLAVSTVLSAFMLGLGLGAVVIGRYTPRLKNPLKTYGLLEIGIGITGLIVLVGPEVLQPFFSFVSRYFSNIPFILYLIKFLISFALMLPATFLMGGTLPVLVMALIWQNAKLGKEVGWLYGINTLGAVSGTIFSGFYSIRIYGLEQSLFIAAAVNIFIGLVTLILSANRDMYKTILKAELPKETIAANEGRWIYIIFAITGFYALGYEVVWNRLLVFIMTNSVYAFTIMLATFLFGIALGSGIGSKLTGTKDLVRLFGILLGATVLFALFASIGLKYLPEIHNAVFVLKPTTTWWELNFFRTAEAFVVMIIPTIFMGISFPIASRLIVKDFQSRGKNIGKLYLYNTLGGMTGSIVIAFLIIPYIGLTRSIIFLILLNAGTALYVLIHSVKRISLKVKYAIWAMSLILAGSAFSVPLTFFHPVFSVTEKDFKLIDFREGIEGTVTVHEKKNINQTIRLIDVDGLNVAGTSFMLRTLQTLQGHLPLFANPDAKRVLQIGFGTGQTSHCVLTHDSVRFRVIEISRDVVDISNHYFNSINRDVVDNPNFKLTIADGKNFLRYTDDKFDIIMNDANYAVATASASLFTKEHFANGRDRLNVGGIFSTWMTTDLDPIDFKIVLKTFRSVYPHCLLWMAPNCINKQVVLMGSMQPFSFHYNRWRALMQDAKIKKDLQQININSIEDLLSCLVLDEGGIDSLVDDVPVNTDNHPVLEFSTRAVRARDFCAYQNLASILNYLPDLEKYIVSSSEDSSKFNDLKKSVFQYSEARRKLLTGMLYFYQGQTLEAMNTLLNGARIIPQSEMGRYYFDMMDILTNQLTNKLAKDPSDPITNLEFIRYQIGMGQYTSARHIIRGKLKINRSDPDLYYELGRCYVAEGKPDSALYCFEKAKDFGQSNPAVFYYTGSLEIRQNRYDEAKVNFLKALKRDPRLFEALNGLAEISQKQYRYTEAIKLYKKSLVVSSYQPEVYSQLGDCYLKLNQVKKAIIHYKKAIGQSWKDAHTFFNLANAYNIKGDFMAARFYYKETLKIDTANPEIYYNLGNTLAATGDFKVAISAFRKAIEINPENEDYYNNLALSYRAMGRLNEAMSVFNEAQKKHRHSKLLQDNARITRKLLTEN